jgi:excisionase family DNA binding protein
MSRKLEEADTQEWIRPAIPEEFPRVVYEADAATEPGQASIEEDTVEERSLPAVLSVDEVAVLLRVNRKTAYEAVARGDIPGTRRVGRAIRIDRDVVLDWLLGKGRVSRSARRQQ